tara:strand:+ start:878 stop:1507 length:630 start_codon:yes stop_codon:yes gene_type:complete
MKFKINNTMGEVTGDLEVQDRLFSVAMREDLVHQVVVAQHSNLRQGTVGTKNRAAVAGGGRKPFRQKGTGNARQGTIRAPHMRGGGVTFGGVNKRVHDKKVLSKMKVLAIKCLLSDKTQREEIRILEKIDLSEPKTKNMVQVIKSLKVEGSLLIATDSLSKDVILSARNIPRVKTIPVALLNAYDLVRYKYLMVTVDTVRYMEKLWGEG